MVESQARRGTATSSATPPSTSALGCGLSVRETSLQPGSPEQRSVAAGNAAPSTGVDCKARPTRRPLPQASTARFRVSTRRLFSPPNCSTVVSVAECQHWPCPRRRRLQQSTACDDSLRGEVQTERNTSAGAEPRPRHGGLHSAHASDSGVGTPSSHRRRLLGRWRGSSVQRLIPALGHTPLTGEGY